VSEFCESTSQPRNHQVLGLRFPRQVKNTTGAEGVPSAPVHLPDSMISALAFDKTQATPSTSRGENQAARRNVSRKP
jgi:hypothetical protein